MNPDPHPNLDTSGSTLRSLIWKFFLMAPLVAGILFPNTWWGLHLPSFLNSPLNYVWLIVAIGLVFSPWEIWVTKLKSFPLPKLGNTSRFAISVLSSFLLVVMVAQFPILKDLFGDAESFTKAFDNQSGDLDHYQYLFSLNVFHPKGGERTVLNLAAVLVDEFGFTVEEAFQRIGQISLFLYALILSVTSQWLMGLRGLFWGLVLVLTPTLLNFMGHVEIYAPLFPALAGFCCLSLYALRSKSKLVLLLGLPLMLFLCLKFHLSSLLLLPIWGLLIFTCLKSSKTGFPAWFNWKKMALFFLLPLFVGALILYFGVLGDYNDARDPRIDSSSYDRIFLPVVPPEVPLDRYHLFHFNHLFDFFNLLWICCPLVIAIFLKGIASQGRGLGMKQPAVLLLSLTTLLYLGFFFLLNPLLGMPLDWDLMAIPAPVLSVLALAILYHSPAPKYRHALIGPGLALAFWSLAVLPVHSNAISLSNRYVALGKHTFKTYWIGSMRLLQAGALMKIDDPSAFMATVETALDDLQPSAVVGNDLEYAILAKNYGNYLRQRMNRPQDALGYHELAYRYDSTLTSNLSALANLSMSNQRYQDAIRYCKRWMAETPDEPSEALFMGTEAALKANEMNLAIEWTRKFVSLNPKYTPFSVLLDRLENRKELDLIYEAFLR